jgi:probable F420-dependent oxidoreductase
MKLGFTMPNLVQLKAMHQQPWELRVTGADQARLARLADELGYAMISAPEHFVIPVEHVGLSGSHYPSAFTAMAFWAGATSEIRVNSCVSLLPLQSPVVTAKTLSTMDWLSGGRVTVTFGVGWLKEEFDALRVPFAERGAIADEYVQAIKVLWTEDVAEFEGKYVSFSGVVFDPKPVQRPHIPLWFGGDANPMLRRVARFGSGWWPFLTRPADIPAKLDYIRSQPDYSGGLADVFYAVGTGRIGEGHVEQTSPDARPGLGKQELIDQLGQLAQLGVTISSLMIPPVDSLEEYLDYARWVAAEVIPEIAPL